MVVPGAPALVGAHREAGSTFEADGLRSFVRSEGFGPNVLLMHGLPASSFLYRRVLPELAARGLRGVAFDLPGMGLAERPGGFDYSIAGLGRFAASAVDALGLESFHLVVHDAGGPIGFELARRRPDRVRSLTILNTVVELPSTPFPGELWARMSHRAGPVLGSPHLWRQLMRRVGVVDATALTDAEIDAYRLLALGDDDGAGYLRIMRSLRTDRPAAERSYVDVVDDRRTPYPVQVLWGAQDPILTLRRRGTAMLAATHLDSMTVATGRHYLQEECAPLIADLVRRFAAAQAWHSSWSTDPQDRPGRTSYG